MMHTAKTKYCKNCNNTYKRQVSNGLGCCSILCRDQLKIILTNIKYENKTEGHDYVTCVVCGLKSPNLIKHINSMHSMNAEMYRKTYNNAPLQAQYVLNMLSERVKGDKNPAYQHGGKFSPFSEKFVGKTNIQETKRKAAESRNKNNSHTTTIQYWLKRGYDEITALEMLKNRQQTFSLEKCIEKYGIEEGTDRWNKRQLKWQATLDSKSDEEKARINAAKMPKIGPASKAEKELLLSLQKLNIQAHGQKKLSYGTRNYYYDIVLNNKIIEYNGDYWHCNPKKYKKKQTIKQNGKMTLVIDVWKKDKLKIQTAKDQGYEVLVIWESDYKANKQDVIDKCITFLTQ